MPENNVDDKNNKDVSHKVSFVGQEDIGSYIAAEDSGSKNLFETKAEDFIVRIFRGVIKSRKQAKYLLIGLSILVFALSLWWAVKAILKISGPSV